MHMKDTGGPVSEESVTAQCHADTHCAWPPREPRAEAVIVGEVGANRAVLGLRYHSRLLQAATCRRCRAHTESESKSQLLRSKKKTRTEGCSSTPCQHRQTPGPLSTGTTFGHGIAGQRQRGDHRRTCLGAAGTLAPRFPDHGVNCSHYWITSAKTIQIQDHHI